MSKSLLSRLSVAAIALPGLMQTAQAGRAEEDYKLDYQYAHYEESGNRMKADVFDLSASAPVGKAMTVSLGLIRDVLSGASPMFNKRDTQGKVQQVLSGASITEQRDVINAGLSYAFDDVTVGVSGGVSGEHDYLSRYINTSVSWDLNKKLTTLNFSVSTAFDDVFPTGKSYRRSRNNQQVLLGVTQIIDKNSLLQANMTFTTTHGFLSDPYKSIYVSPKAGALFGNILSDSRPTQKFQWAWLLRYVRSFKKLNQAALHADYRLYVDNWGINAHTLALSWHQPLGDDWQVIPRFRYYTQGQADFYQAVFASNYTGSIHSSDYRLAGFGTLGGGLKVSKSFHQVGVVNEVKLQTAFDYFDRKSSYQIGGNSNGSFDNFSFWMVTASVNVKF